MCLVFIALRVWIAWARPKLFGGGQAEIQFEDTNQLGFSLQCLIFFDI